MNKKKEKVKEDTGKCFMTQSGGFYLQLTSPSSFLCVGGILPHLDSAELIATWLL